MREQAEKRFEIGEGVLSLMEHGADPTAMEEDDDSFKKDDEEEGAFAGYSQKMAAATTGMEKQERASERARFVTLKGRLRPLLRDRRSERLPQALPAGGHVFAKVEPIAEVGDEAMTMLVDGLQGDGSTTTRRAMFSPMRGCARQRGARRGCHGRRGRGRPRRRDDPEMSKQVSTLASALPSIFDARDASAVEVDGTFADSLLLQDLRVVDSDGDEERAGAASQAVAKLVRSEKDPEEALSRRQPARANIAEADVNGLKMLDLKLASATTKVLL